MDLNYKHIVETLDIKIRSVHSNISCTENIFIKNNVITILFFDKVSLFEVKSNLPKEKILKIAETIHINY